MRMLDPEYYKWCLQQYEEIRQRRNSFKGIPDKYDRLLLQLDRIFEQFYRSILK
jgi:hypothetical protein